MHSDREGFLVAEWWAKTLKNNSNDDSIFISLRWKITLLKKGEWNTQNTLYSLRKGFQVVYLLDCMNIQDPWTICKE